MFFPWFCGAILGGSKAGKQKFGKLQYRNSVFRRKTLVQMENSSRERILFVTTLQEVFWGKGPLLVHCSYLLHRRGSTRGWAVSGSAIYLCEECLEISEKHTAGQLFTFIISFTFFLFFICTSRGFFLNFFLLLKFFLTSVTKEWQVKCDMNSGSGAAPVLFSLKALSFAFPKKGWKNYGNTMLWSHILVCLSLQFSPAVLVFLKKHGMHIKCFYSITVQNTVWKGLRVWIFFLIDQTKIV